MDGRILLVEDDPSIREVTALGLRGAGPARVITDLGVLEPDPETISLAEQLLRPPVIPGPRDRNRRP